MNCANCDRDIYWSHGILNWCHFDKTISCGERNGYKLFADIDQTPFEYGSKLKIEEDRKNVCKHCEKEIRSADRGKGWEHTDGLLYCELDHWLVAEPKDDLIILDEVKAIPTDCIECNEIRYGGSGKYADFAVCHIIDMGDYGYSDPSFLFGFKKNKPKNHIPPDWCPLKPKEPELCGILQHAWDRLDISCRLPKGHQGNHAICCKVKPFTWDTPEPEKTYPIELKRRDLKGWLSFLIDKHDNGKLSTKTLIEMIFQNVKANQQSILHPNTTDFRKCWTCGGSGRISCEDIAEVSVPCSKCDGTGIMKSLNQLIKQFKGR